MNSYMRFIERKQYEKFAELCVENNIDLDSILSFSSKLEEGNIENELVSEFASNMNMIGQAMNAKQNNFGQTMGQNNFGQKPLANTNQMNSANQQQINQQQKQMNSANQQQTANKNMQIKQLATQLQGLQQQLNSKFPELGARLNQIASIAC